MSVTTQGPYTAGALVRVATWYIDPTSNLLKDGYRDANGNPADPVTVTLKWRTPDAVVHTATYPAAPVVKSPTQQSVSAGLYQADLDTTGLPGTWQYEWVAPQGDPVQSIQPASFVVQAPYI